MSQRDGLAHAEKAYKLAYTYLQEHTNCSQCVIAAIQDVFGCVSDEVFKAAYGLAGGGTLTGSGTCGALSGAFLVIGSLSGRERSTLEVKPKKPFKQCRRLYDMFLAVYGSCLCRDVQMRLFGRTYDLWNRDDYREFEADGGHRDKCPEVVGKTAAWLASILCEEGYGQGE